MADEARIVKTTFSSEGTIELPPREGEQEPQILNLFQACKSAWRFETDDGRYAVTPIDNELLDDGSFLAFEAEAREQALKVLGFEGA